MDRDYPLPDQNVLSAIHAGLVIPAHPLALDRDRHLDEISQRALTRYYHAAGVGGIAVAVHTTQFEIRLAKHGLLRPVLELAAETSKECDQKTGKSTVLIAGVVGNTTQAVSEAELARDLGYHAGLLSLSAFQGATEDQLLRHCRTVATHLPLVGFYLQPAAGGIRLSRSFWRGFAEIPNVVAIKIAPFNRYQTLDVLRAVAEVGRAGDIAMYTGNDDNIVPDLVTTFAIGVDDPAQGTGCGPSEDQNKDADHGADERAHSSARDTRDTRDTRDRPLLAQEGDAGDRPPLADSHSSRNAAIRHIRIVGGLLGHWSYWTKKAVELFDLCKSVMGQTEAVSVPAELLTLGAQITESNAAVFDAANDYHGVIAGVQEVLRREGLIRTSHTLDPAERLSPGQGDEIERIYRLYPHLTDSEFIAIHRDEWLR